MEELHIDSRSLSGQLAEEKRRNTNLAIECAALAQIAQVQGEEAEKYREAMEDALSERTALQHNVLEASTKRAEVERQLQVECLLAKEQIEIRTHMEQHANQLESRIAELETELKLKPEDEIAMLVHRCL